jgi:hypothetical protein
VALLHSRGFETDVRTYIELAGFIPDLTGLDSLSDVSLEKFYIRDPFFFRKIDISSSSAGEAYKHDGVYVRDPLSTTRNQVRRELKRAAG